MTTPIACPPAGGAERGGHDLGHAEREAGGDKCDKARPQHVDGDPAVDGADEAAKQAHTLLRDAQLTGNELEQEAER